MNVSICLDQYASNYNLNALSSNGFNIYTDIDNFTTPIAQGIPYQNLFSAPIGNCPYLLTNVPAGATQLLVIDNCSSTPPTETSTPPTSQELLIDCCYALLDIPSESPTTSSFCTTCSLDFDVFSSSYVGQIVAGNLASSCGPVTDYTIGWYKDGDYSSPEFISGFGNAFLPYQSLHPLTGNSAVPAAAGDWEGIIHDITINGITYSSVSGSANGQPIPFETCFGTIVVDPLTCNNGPISSSVSKYSHQFTFNSQAVGTTASPVSFTYNLSSNTKYFAYIFEGASIWDELQIKFISGNPAATNNPSLYSQPIYLEKIRIGSDAPNIGTIPNTNALPDTYPIPTDPNQTLNNIWPKRYNVASKYQRTLTLTTLQTSSNPLTPDYLEITITPNPANNNTQWRAGFQCLTDFDCTNCVWEDYPNNLPKIWKIGLVKFADNGCNKQKLALYLTSSCNYLSMDSDWMGSPYNPNNPISIEYFNNPNVNLIGSWTPKLNNPSPTSNFPTNGGFLSLTPNVSCATTQLGSISCGQSSTGQITLNKTQNQIQLTFNLESDYLHYKNALIAEYNLLSTANTSTPLTSQVSCPAGSTNVDYYRGFYISIPTQGVNANCGDSSIQKTYRFHFNDYFNILYNESPSTNTWSITIPQTSIVNCYPQNLGCDTCYNTINGYVNTYNSDINSITTFTFTTNVGAKYSDPVRSTRITRTVAGGTSGSYCIDGNAIIGQQVYPWYSTHTIPFISSSTGWVNLNSLKAFVPCITSSFPNGLQVFPDGNCYYGQTHYYQVRFPHLTSSFNTSLSTNDFEIYALAGYGPTGSLYRTPNSNPLPCPETSGSKIYSYIGGIVTMYSSSHFWNGTLPTLEVSF